MLFDSLKKLKQKMLIIDVYELSRRVRYTRESKKLIKGKDVIFVIGKTGNGKTTTILRFLGVLFKEKPFKGGRIYVPDKGMKP